MSRTAVVYFGCVVALACFVLARAISHWETEDPARFFVYLAFAFLAGTLKVRLPGITGTFSLNFLFVLIGVANLTSPETLVIAGTSMAVQSVWRSSNPARWIHLLFNVSAITICVQLAFTAARSFPLPFLLQLAVASGVYFLTNTILVSGILTLAEDKSFLAVWSRWFRWFLAYYGIGVTTTALILIVNRQTGWGYALLILPIMYLEYMCLCYDIKEVPGT